MRQVTATEKYRAVNEGKMAKGEFVRQMRMAYPSLITQFNGFDDSVQILKTKGYISEQKGIESYDSRMDLNISLESIARGVRYELTGKGIDPTEALANRDEKMLGKIEATVVKNLKKDPLHYINLLAKESSKVDKNDKFKETKRGALEKDTFNDMKKATLKEMKQNLVEGTRALVGYLSGDTLTTTYNHYDGYPENLGVGLEKHYNDDDKAKDVAMKGYITFLDPETGEIEQTHKDAPGKLKLPEDVEERAREIATQIDSMYADYGYIWVDEANMWTVIKNTGIRSMIDQIVSKISEGNYDMEEEVVEVDSTLDPNEDRKAILKQVIMLLKTEKAADTDIIKDFIRTHMDDILNAADDQAILDEFDDFVSVNYESPSDFMEGEVSEEYKKGFDTLIEAIKELNTDGDEIGAAQDAMEFIGQHYGIDFEFGAGPSRMAEKKGKDHDGDGDVDGDDYMAAKDKAIKGAMGKDNVKEAVKSIIQKVLEEQVLNEAATNELARIADDYAGFEGLKPAVISLENIVTEIEAFYDKTRAKIQKIYNDLGEIKNEEGLKVGAFIAPSIEAAFNKDLRPAVKKGFTSGLETPKVKTISRTDVDRGYIQQEAPKDTVFTPVNEKKK
jgi:hypothetical protein